MAVRILNGEKAEDIPFETITEYGIYINSEAIDSFNLTIPDDIKDKAQEAKAV